MIRYLRISFYCRFKASELLLFEVRHLARQLRYYGYVLGEGLHVGRGEDHRDVSLTAYFTGRDAWETAQKDTRDHVDFHLEGAMRESRGEARVTELKRPHGGPVPACKCGAKARPALDLWCTPETDAPPLLCSKGGVIEFYKLPLSSETLRRLDWWRSTSMHIARLHFEEVGEGPYRRWTEEQLFGKASWLSRESVELAKVLGKELDRKVRPSRPPARLMRL